MDKERQHPTGSVEIREYFARYALQAHKETWRTPTMEEEFESCHYPLALPISGYPVGLWREDGEVEITWVMVYLN